MKSIIAIAAAALISLPAVAADKDSKAMASFLSEVAYSKNLAKYDDAKVSLDGFVFMVEPMQDQPGYYIAQLSDSNSGGRAVHKVIGARLLCVINKQVAKTLNPHGYVQLTAHVRDIQEANIQDYPGAPMRHTRLIVSNCNFM